MLEYRYFLCAKCHRINRVSSEKMGRVLACGRCRETIAQDGSPAEITDAVLPDLVKKAPVPVLVDFWAPWCAPCQTLAPYLEDFAVRHAGRLIVVKLNTEENQRTAALLSIRSVPTLALYKAGELHQIHPGALVGEQLENFVAPHLTFIS
ncbi:MAG: thioredoxin 2 [Myxococcota bacterium]|jgi:thioredoxin 2